MITPLDVALLVAATEMYAAADVYANARTRYWAVYDQVMAQDRDQVKS
jgi:hypothetical protein